MVKGFLTLLLSCIGLFLNAQTIDTTIYQVAEESPRFPGCEELDSLKQRQDCATQNMLQYIYERIRYPEEARAQGIEGTVVVSFVVEKDGSISDPTVVRGLEGGASEEALRVVRTMQENQVQWIPGKNKGHPVRVRFNLPIRFKLEESKDYVLLGRDSVYTMTEKEAAFKDGDEALAKYLETHLQFPKSGIDSCYIGHMDVTILVRPNGETRVLDLANYSDLGFDFIFEAVSTAHKMWYKWEPAIYKGRKVGAAVDIRMTFLPPVGSCSSVRMNFEKAQALAEEGTELFNQEKQEEGLAKLTEAIDLFPQNAQFRYMRGQMHVQMQEFGKACEDYRYVRQVLNIPEVDQLTGIICNRQ